MSTAAIAAVLPNITRIIRHVEEETRQLNRFTAPGFSPFRFMPSGEVPTTHLLTFFLNADEDHGQGQLFQELFIARLRGLTPVARLLPTTHWQVLAERRLPEVGQIDLLLVATGQPAFSICIENKPRDSTADQYRQLTRYHNYLLSRHRSHPVNYLLLYLSRTTRLPHEDSLSKSLRETLQASGHYANITYRDFLLPLLDDWRRAARPPHLRRFLRQFRHQLEQWLDLPSTKPASLMKETAIAAELMLSPDNISAAYNIANALPTLHQNLLSQLMQALATPVPGLVGNLHWEWKGFETGANGRPFLVRRISGDAPDNPSAWLWGRYSITIEFEHNRLYYGIRHDTTHWHPADIGEHRYTAEEVRPLEPLLGEEVHDEEDWWVWWAWAGPTNERELCVAIADGSLIPKLQEEVLKLAGVLDAFCALSPA